MVRVIGMLVWSCLCACNGSGRFDAMKWRDYDCFQDSYLPQTYREEVVDVLLTKVLPGMHQDSVLSMLGPPDKTDTLPTWCLGPRSALRMHFDWLTLHFNENGSFGKGEKWND